MVNRDNMRKWVAALRSGEFQQGKKRLATKHGNGWRYCGLGVACEVAIRDGLELEVWHLDAPSPPCKGYGRPAETVSLPEEVRQWLGVDERDVVIEHRGLLLAASSANDLFDWSFELLADAIEKYYELREE